MNFETFLKKYTVKVDAFNRVVDDPLNPKHEFKAVGLKTLGEWAFEQEKYWSKELQLANTNKSIEIIGQILVYKNISFNCLGKKRLRELQEKDND